MRKDVYENLLKIVRNMSDSYAEAAIVREAIYKNNLNDLCLTIKNYHTHKGLSRFIYNDIANTQEIYEIKGPMGIGLSLKPTGKHIAYTAGTGVLVFMDLVAYLLIKMIEKNGGPSILSLPK